MGFDCPSRESDPRLLAEILVIFPPAALALANGFVILDEYKFRPICWLTSLYQLRGLLAECYRRTNM